MLDSDPGRQGQIDYQKQEVIWQCAQPATPPKLRQRRCRRLASEGSKQNPADEKSAENEEELDAEVTTKQTGGEDRRMIAEPKGEMAEQNERDRARPHQIQTEYALGFQPHAAG